jgi:hypothetical protein
MQLVIIDLSSQHPLFESDKSTPHNTSQRLKMNNPHKKNFIKVNANDETKNKRSGFENLILMFFSQQTYSGLFKAGTVAAGIYLIGISQSAMSLYDKEIDAYSEKFKFEASTHLPLEQTDCNKLSSYQAECFIAQHKINTSRSSLDALKSFIDAAKIGSISFYTFSVFFFFATPFVRSNYSNEGRDT